ncbi:MAG: hypothetical protein ABJB05_15310, partial [Parafilimonas sp.]
MPVKLSFPKAGEQDFYTTLNKKVDEFFTSASLSKKANGLMFFKVFFYSGIYIATYLILITANPPLILQFVLWIVLGLFTAFIGLNISHDAVHGSLSSNKSVNKVLGYSFNV